MRFRKVARFRQQYNSTIEQYRSIAHLPPHVIENTRDRYDEDVRRADAEYEECKRKSVN